MGDGGSYMSEVRSWSNIPLCAVDGRQGMVAFFSPGGRERLPVIEGIDLAGWLPGYQGSQQRSTPLTTPLISCHSGDALFKEFTQSLAGVGAGM